MFLSIHQFICVFALFHLALGLSPRVLQPLPRHRWHRPSHSCPPGLHYEPKANGSHSGNGCGHRNSTTPQVDVELQDDEQLLWGSPNATNTPAVSIIRPYPGQRIIDMERFAAGLVSAECTENLVFHFSHRSDFDRARRSWDWVNGDAQRAFVLVGSPELCKSGTRRDPWLVRHVTYETDTLVARVDTVKKAWTEVTYAYDIDFGAADSASAQRKRSSFWDLEFERAFEIPLTTTLGPAYDFAQPGLRPSQPAQAFLLLACPPSSYS
ncbi:hypothetical protein ACEPPN_014180 [Leptodophora sp. 'Broadleaf-Isolate-01']